MFKALMFILFLFLLQLVREIHALKQIVTTTVNWWTTKQGVSAREDTNLAQMDDRVLTRMSALIIMETVITTATTTMVLTLAHAGQAMI